MAVEYTLPVVLHILLVDSNDKGTGYAAGSIVVAHVSCIGCKHPGLVTFPRSSSFAVVVTAATKRSVVEKGKAVCLLLVGRLPTASTYA